jgi:lipoate-protein ligase B
MVTQSLSIYHCGLIPYRQAAAWMRTLWRSRRDEETTDLLLLIQHPTVITLGMSGGHEDILLPPEILANRGIECISSERGGRATLHSPGQLVAYPIRKLNNDDLFSYVWNLEEVVVKLLTGWGISGYRIDGYPGIWTNEQKIAAVGLAIREGVVYHGLSLNVANDLSLFQYINPCGFQPSKVTTMQAELGFSIRMSAVENQFVQEFSRVFNYQVTKNEPALTVQTIAYAEETPQWLVD